MFSAPVPNAIGRGAFWHGPLHPITIPTVGVRSSRVRARACVWNAYSTKYFVRVRFLRYYSRVHIVHLLPLILTGVAPMRCPKLLHSFDCFAKYATHTCQGQACWSVKAIRRSPPIRLYIHTPPLFLLLHKPARKRTKSDRSLRETCDRSTGYHVGLLGHREWCAGHFYRLGSFAYSPASSRHHDVV